MTLEEPLRPHNAWKRLQNFRIWGIEASDAIYRIPRRPPVRI